MSNDEDDYSDADEEYNTDDDDSSWKVRYAAVNALGAAIASQKDNLSLLWEMNCLDTLLGRFKEREENVRVEVRMDVSPPSPLPTQPSVPISNFLRSS